MKPANGARDEELLLSGSTALTPTSWSQDGRFLLHTFFGRGVDVAVLELESRKSTPLLTTQFNESEARFSRDGRFVAYISNESGKPEVYVREFVTSGAQPSLGGKWAVSNGPGSVLETGWSANGRTIYYSLRESGGISIMAVDVETSPEFRAGRTRVHMRLPATITGGTMSRDGSRALLVIPVESDAGDRTFNVVLNWPSLIESR